ncbi:hypothetical protein [Legionella cincinnatiensis]|nr:hypothetical protein [Legionella cincinnatiensis]
MPVIELASENTLQHSGAHVDIKPTNFLLAENDTLDKHKRELWATPC